MEYYIMNSTEYKKYHESFMENNHGSSLVHTLMCIFYTVQCSLKTSVKDKYQSELKQYAFEYVTIVLPMILVHTVAPNGIQALIFIDSLYLMCHFLRNYKKPLQSKTALCKNNFRSKHILSVTCLRGLTYLITVFSILAVDFKQFPRYLAKTERFGYSLMDTGVGLFVLMSGLVHKDITKNYRLVVVRNFKFIALLVILGVARFISVKQLDYQEHVTEYGVHWNFFFTLAVCKFISSTVLCFCYKPLILSICTVILHELLLASGLQEWVFSDTPRDTFVNANREGIASSLGYISLYLFAVHLKQELTDESTARYKLLLRLTCGSVSLLFLSYFVNIAIPTSRTLANAGYSLYLACILTSILTVLYLLEVLSQDKETHIKFEVPLILSNINKNGLVYFLLANLTTGAINMSMQTLLLPAVATFAIINLYMVFTLTVIVYLNKKGISV